MLEIACPLCAADNAEEIYPERLLALANEFDYLSESPSHYRIVRCKSCGLIYSNPIYDQEKIISLYANAGIEHAVDPLDLPAIKANMRRYIGHLVQAAGAVQGKLLDVGCGTGDLLREAMAAGFTVTGIEPSVAAAKCAAESLGLDSILNGPYLMDTFAPAQFDRITLVHVLDHVTAPLQMLRAAYQHLKPGGYVLGAVHNISSLLAKLTGENFIGFSVQHICYFDRPSITRMLNAAGFEVVSIKGSLTTYPLKHYIENGIRNESARRKLLNLLHTLGLSGTNFTFPFGNIEIVGRKG